MRNNIPITAKITHHGKILGVTELAQKSAAARDAGRSFFSSGKIGREKLRESGQWIFAEGSECRREFPDALVFKNTGWVFELTPGECQLQAGEGTNAGCRQKETDHGSYL